MLFADGISAGKAGRVLSGVARGSSAARASLLQLCLDLLPTCVDQCFSLDGMKEFFSLVSSLISSPPPEVPLSACKWCIQVC
jgi:hypothetical protein